MSPRGPTLPGADRHATTTYRDPQDRVVTIDHAALQTQILAALAEGPRAKWELRATLHIAEAVIARELRVLRTQHTVKITGRQQTAIKWALASWQPAPSPAKGHVPDVPDAQTVVREKKPTPPADESWWTRPDLTRAQFQARALKGADVAS